MEQNELIINNLQSFFKEMNNWEKYCYEINNDNNLSYIDKLEKQKNKLKEIFDLYCVSKDRKMGRLENITYGLEGSYNYNMDEEIIGTVIFQNNKKTVVETNRERPIKKKNQYTFVLKNGKWLIDSKKVFLEFKGNWQNTYL